MGESRPETSAPTSCRDEAQAPATPTTPKAPITPRQPISLVQPSQKNKKNKPKIVRVFRSVFRSFPIINPTCKFPTIPVGLPTDTNKCSSGTRVTGTLFGYRKGKVSLSVQENRKCLPSLVVELAMQTNVLQKELSAGMVRIALECEKRAEKDKVKLFDEPLWTMYSNGKKTGYGVKREATEEDLNVMELLKAVSMGAGVLPGNSETEGQDGELAYIRAYFDRVIGSKDSETFYMLSPDGNNGPELSIFFVRI
ncbi:protein MIZU-KUSSEI 1 [Durio zibethinus]|uniref:Protein MIZU-KUSSEI 1 n=1 Tax=Durio zibethinus TaxID=66656 RepID=A0A6P5YLL6_DURZI|nr:protein MIZU-KUSSEI 1 [Durio zibethinus]